MPIRKRPLRKKPAGRSEPSDRLGFGAKPYSSYGSGSRNEQTKRPQEKLASHEYQVNYNAGNEPTKESSSDIMPSSHGDLSYRRQKLTPKRHHNCTIAYACGSCAYINKEYNSSLEEKFQRGITLLKSKNLAEGVKFFPANASPQQLGYRCYFKLAIRPFTASNLPAPEDESIKVRRFEIGLFQPGTHKVIDITSCPLHYAPLKKLLKDLPALLEESPLEPYSETTQNGDLRYLSARASHLTSEIMMVFVVTDLKHKNHLRQIVSALREKGHNISSAFMNLNNSQGNEIFSQSYHKITGSDTLRERLLGFDFLVGPGNFFQINPPLAQNIYSRIDQLIGPSVHDQVIAWDLYSGVGAISFVLAKLGYRVLSIEESPTAIEHLKIAAKKNGFASKISALSGKVEHVYSQIPVDFEKPQVICVNPSRKGIAQDVLTYLDSLLKLPPAQNLKFVYMSCDISSLTRDLESLKLMGLRLRQVEGFDMFPGTDKVEWLAMLTK